MRKIKFVILLTFVGFLFITSCKKDKPTNSETEEPIPLVLDSNTVVLNLNNVSSIIEAHENYMIVSNLSIGNGRIASGHGSIELKQNSHFACEPNDKYPKGAFKKVESIEPYGQGTNYTQINFYAYSLNDPIPQITEAVISGSAKETKAVTNEISSVYDNLGNLIPITFDGGKLKLELTKTIDLDDDLRTTDDQFKLTGTFKSNIDLEFDMRFKNKEIEKLKLGCKITPELDVKVSKSMKKPLYQVKKKINLYNIYLNPIVVPMGVPPIVFPVVFNPVIAINAEVSATGDVKIEGTVLEYKSSFGAGFEYSKSNGYKDYKSANFPPISLNPSLTLDFEGQLKAKIEPELSYRLYDQPDISVSTGLGAYAKLKLTASAGTPPPNFDLNLESYMGLEGKLGAKLKLFKKSIVDWEFSYTIAEVKILDVKKFVTNWNANPTVTDIDGNVYHTVKIGTQTWMVENLKTTKYNDGNSISNVTNNISWSNLTTGAYCYYNNDVTNNETYGKLYNWYAVNTGKLAPLGWHIPTDAEWITLINYLGGESVAGNAMKANILWNNPISTNSNNFKCLPAGYRTFSGQFYNINYGAYFWTFTQNMNNTAWHIDLNDNDPNAFINGNFLKNSGNSIRCVKD